MCRDADDGWIAVEIKRIGTIDAVEQLTRYLERIRLDPAMADCQGVLAAQQIKPQARDAGRVARDRLCRGRPRGAPRRAPAGPHAFRALNRLAAMADEDPVLTERRDGVLLITLNRPDARNAINLDVAEGIAAALEELDADDELTRRRPDRRGQGLQRGHGSQGVRQRQAPVGRGPRLRRDRAQVRAQAADRRRRGLRRRRRVRGRAGLRPDRRLQGRAARHPRGQALARRRRRRAVAPAAPGSPTAWRWSWR